MIRASIISALVGMTLGVVGTYIVINMSQTERLNRAVSSSSSDQIVQLQQKLQTALQHNQTLQQETAMQAQENAWLLKMVKAGLSGDMKGHMQTFRQRPQITQSRAIKAKTKPSPEQSSIEATSQPNVPQSADAISLVQRLQRADKQLQKQALAEGWASGSQLADERAALWQQAREMLSDQQYMQGLHAVGLPNQLFMSGIRGEDNRALGLKYGDRLVSVSGEKVFTRNELNRQLKMAGKGAIVAMTFERKGKLIPVEISHADSMIEFYGKSIAVN